MSYAAGQKLRASQLSTFVCTSTTRPTGHSGQWIYETDTQLLLMYDGAAWRPIAATGAVAQDVEYNSATNQSIGNAADTILEMGTANVTSPLVTRTVSGVGHVFALNRPGRWAATTTLRYGFSTADGERYFAIRRNGTEVIASSGSSKSTVGSPHTVNLSVVKRFAAGDTISCWTFQGSGATRAMEANNAAAWGRLNLSWIGP